MKYRLLLILLLISSFSAAQTFQEWKSRAEKGEVEAMHQMGRFYFVGDSVQQDFKIALSWFQRGVEHNYPHSIYNVALCNLIGAGVRTDTIKAIQILHQAIALGYTPAMGGLATIYRNGGTYANTDSCVYWERKAAELGYIYSQCMLSIYYECGFGVEVNLEEAFKWLLLAAEQGDEMAEEGVAICYRDGKGVQQDSEKMIYWLEKAAIDGRNNSLVYLGFLYQQGLYGLTIDKSKAFELFKIAADSGDSWGAFELGQCYRYGKGTTQDKELARFWIKKAADEGFQSAVDAWKEIDTGIDENELRLRNEEYKQWFKTNR